MQVPEKLALIGGSILLSSTLVFTLKSQASSIIPHVGHSISHVFDHIGDAQRNSDFNNNYRQAQKSGQPTGELGTAQYYIDKNNNLYIGGGKLDNTIDNDLGTDIASQLNSINFTQPVQAPQDSRGLLADLGSVNAINGFSKVDFSNVADRSYMFNQDGHIGNIDVNNIHGNIGTAPFHTDDHANLYIDGGAMNDTVYNTLGKPIADRIKSVNFTQPIQAPQGTNGILAQLPQITAVNGYHQVNLDHSDTSFMFNQDDSINNIDINNIHGNIGTAPFHIDDHANLYIDGGAMNNTVYNVLNKPIADRIKSINFMEPVQAPQNINGILAQFPQITNINGYHQINFDHSDTSFMLNYDNSLTHIDGRNR